jgi:RHS repeat-associated protein
MPLFPAAKMMDTVIGVDVHAVAPIPGIPIHPYVGPVYLWHQPTFPSTNVFINGMPALSVGAMGYFFHVPQGVPVPPTPTNQGYWKRYLLNIPMVLVLTALTMLANLAIAGISSLIPKPKSVENFIKDVTGIDTSSRASTWESIKGSFAAYTQWQTWVKLLMPPLPYPGAQGSVAIGSPNVTVNGGPLAFVAPLMATSCSDIPIVPNAVTLGFSNVLVGVSFADMVRGIAVHAAQGAVSAAVQKGVASATHGEEEQNAGKPAEEDNDKCDSPGHPVNPVTGAAWNDFTDINVLERFVFRRSYNSAWCNEDGPLGYGSRHSYQHTLSVDAQFASYTAPDSRRFLFRRRDDGSYGGIAFGWELVEDGAGGIQLRHGGAGVLEFRRSRSDVGTAWLVGWIHRGVRDALVYDPEGRLARITQHWLGANGEEQADVSFRYDPAGHIAEIERSEPDGVAQTLASYAYDAAGCLTAFRDALGGIWSFAYDAARRIVRETNPNRYSFHYEYDEQGRCVRTAGDDGLWRVSLQYAPGRTLVTEADNGLWVFSYDELGTIREILDPYGGKRQRMTGPDGRVLVEVDSGGRTMHNLYDTTGRQSGRLDRWGNRWPTKAEAPKLPNPFAHVIPATAMAREWGEARAPAGAVARALPPTIAEAIGAVLPVAAPVASVERRDALGRVIERTDADGATERYQYDPASNCVQVTDADGLAHRHTYGSWNLCIARSDPMGGRTQYRYTRREKIAAIVDPGGAESKYVYDCKDRLTHVKRHGVLRESYRYDEGDRLIEKLDGEGKPLLRLEIGPNGLQNKRVLASGEEHIFAYDPYGNMTEASTTKAKVLIGQAARRRVSDTRNGRGVVHDWVDGQLAATTYFGRFTVRYEELEPGDTLIHLPVGRPHRVTVAADGSCLRMLGNGTYELSRYDAAGHCTGRARWSLGDGTPAWWASYRYSPAGELSAVVDNRGGSTLHRYDAAHRLTGRDGVAGSCAYAYDAAGNLTVTPVLPALAYAEGNLLERAGETMFRYNARNHLAEIAHADGRVTAFHYDSMDLLVRVDGAEGCRTWEAEYDGLCRRTAKIVDGTRTEYFWDGDRLAAEEAPEGRLRIYVYPNATALIPLGFTEYANARAAPAEGKSHFVFHDQIGLPLLIEDAGGHEVWRAAFIEPYGALTVAPGARVAYHLRFPGHYFDTETGLHYNRFRSYSPSLCRYLQSDPAGQSGGVNLYAYIANPVTFVDVLGLSHPDNTDKNKDEGQKQSGHQTEKPGEPGPQPGQQAKPEPAPSEPQPVTPPHDEAPGNQAPFKGEPDTTVRGGTQSRTYGPDGFPKTDRDLPHPDEAGIGAGDHCHDWGRPADGGPPTAADRGVSRLPQPGDPPPPRGPNVPPPTK